MCTEQETVNAKLSTPERQHVLECIRFMLEHPDQKILPCGRNVDEFAVAHVLQYTRKIRKSYEYKPLDIESTVCITPVSSSTSSSLF